MSKPNVRVVHRDWECPFPRIIHAEGIYLYDEQDNRYIDGSHGSSSVTAIGNGVEHISRATYEQAKKFSFYPAHALSNDKFLDLSDLFGELAPADSKK
jgi:adenosylmethionine-8-amino-7-oxononanoate aminotransferase